MSTTTSRSAPADSNRTSRSNSQAAQVSGSSERIVVYKDRDNGPHSDATVRVDTATTAAPPTPRKAFNTSDNGANRNDEDRKSRYLQSVTGDIKFHNSEVYDQLSTTDIVQNPTFVRRLRGIAIRRASLLQQLNELQEEEQEILASLASPKGLPPSNSPSYQFPSTPIVSPTSTRPLNAPLLSRPTMSPSRVPRLQPSKTSQKPQHTRTVSAPTLSTPSGPQRLAPNTSKRVPLGDKTTEALAIRGSTPSRAPTQNTATVTFRPNIELSLLEGKSGPEMRGTTSKIPLKSGTDDDTAVSQDASAQAPPMIPRGVRGRSGSSTRGKSRSRSRSRGRTRVTTPGMARFYEVPPTVARKKWDF